MAITNGYLNDLLCLPIFLPIALHLQRWAKVRHHDHPPMLWEVLQHAAVFSVLFEWVLPHYPKVYHTTGDTWDVVAYTLGGLLAWMIWRWRGAFHPCQGLARGAVQ